MRIRTVHLEVSDPEATGAFYRDVLDQPVDAVDGGVVVRIGMSQLSYTRSGSSRGDHHHLAFTIPADLYGGAKTWLLDRTTLLARDGQDEFECSPDWDARSLYFDGPGGSVLELIARRRLPRSGETRFAPHLITSVSEVGVAVADVPSVRRNLETRGIAPFGGGGDSFRPMGDDHGLVILVEPGRSWFPTDRRSAPTPTVIVADVEGDDVVLDFADPAA